MSETDVRVVLAHGAWADGSSWNKVIAGLRAAGAAAVAAPLPLTSLADDVAALDRALEVVDGPVVLVGHAYAGAVISSATEGNVAALVYVAALAPDEGETVADVFYRSEPHPKAPQLGPDRHGLIWLPSDAFASAFAQQATEEEQALLAATQRPIAAAAIGVQVGRPSWKDKQSWYLVADEDRMIPPETQRFMAERMGAHVHTAPVDHVPMLTSPATVVDIVLEAVRQVERG
ncbi:Alpha/beta hydrolase family protein [Asanoa hainanensis]|uniref:Alpha/beta hydrolase family protein n=1 Tax=Asanoa hainanensis TaxID=560556 RepID=A0A239PD33_9ACTN|nr:alpha/beta hydrolase [Asanoa hainanensis]SNT64548.1 Alpha/beta hydrolase family protein [Asanoa hainanensis]